MEQFANFGAITALNMSGGVNNSATTLTLVSIASPFPSAFPFRIRIDDELMKVTATPGSNQWTVVRADGGTAATSHINGAEVHAVVTKESVDAIVNIQNNGTDTSNRRSLNFVNAEVADDAANSRVNLTFATTIVNATTSLPSASLNTGSLFLPNDGPIWQRSNGSVWSQYGPIFNITKPPLLASWSWVNQGSATAADTTAGLFISSDAVSSDNWRLLMLTAPATPYTRTAGFVGLIPGTNDAKIGIVFRESSSGKLVSFSIHLGTSYDLAVTTNSSPTVGVANPFISKWSGILPILWLRVTDNGTNRLYSVSADGVNFVQLYSESRITYITADQIGIGVNPGTGFKCSATLLSWV